MAMRYLVRPLPLALRLALYAAVELAGMAIQTLTSGGFFPGTVIMIAGMFLMFARSYTNRPKDLGYEEWKPVSFEEVRRIHGNLEGTRTIALPFYHKPAARVILIILFVILAGVGFFLPWAGPDNGAGRYFLGILNAFLVLIPLLFSGSVKLWTPQELATKLTAFEPVMHEKSADGTVTTPYLRFDRDSDGREIPEDLRFMVELKRSPADFVGSQFQVVINNGANGAVPYMYAVFLCRGKGTSYRKVTAMEFDDMVTESGGDDEYGTLVVRQETSGTGYHTTEEDCRRLYRMVTAAMRNLGKQ